MTKPKCAKCKRAIFVGQFKKRLHAPNNKMVKYLYTHLNCSIIKRNKVDELLINK